MRTGLSDQIIEMHVLHLFDIQVLVTICISLVTVTLVTLLRINCPITGNFRQRNQGTYVVRTDGLTSK